MVVSAGASACHPTGGLNLKCHAVQVAPWTCTMHACWLLPLARDRARGASVQSPAQVPFTRFTAGSKFAHEFALSLPDINSSTGGRMDVEDGNSTSTPGHASEGGRRARAGERARATRARGSCTRPQQHAVHAAAPSCTAG